MLAIKNCTRYSLFSKLASFSILLLCSMQSFVFASPYLLSSSPSGEKSMGAQEVFQLERNAAEGNVNAQNDLGLMYSLGLSVGQDYVKAENYYEQAASQGDIGAQYTLGVLYRDGYGVDKDHTKAKYWFEQSANQGYAKAQNMLIEMRQ